MKYALESKNEFERLENQSKSGVYDFRRELEHCELSNATLILDAGCGAGTVSRYLAPLTPSATIHACDASLDRIQQARLASSTWQNLAFETQDLTRLTYPSNFFDVVISRYVIEHLNPHAREAAFVELKRVLKPGGQLYIIDADGILINLYPASEYLTRCLDIITKSRAVDVQIGRKLPALLSQHGLKSVNWDIFTTGSNPSEKNEEISLMRPRLEGASRFFCEVLGGEEECRKFIEEYLVCLNRPDSVYFLNKFVVWGYK